MKYLPYNKNLIGKFIAIGAENIVYRYNADKVIKFPTRYGPRFPWDPEKYCQELQDGFNLLKKYLPNYLNQSQLYFYSEKNKKKYVVIEPLINGKALSKNDLKNKDIKNQFLEIIAAKNQLKIKESLFVDLFGFWGLWISGRWKIPNLLLEKQTKKLYLVDIGTARTNDSRFVIRMLIRLAEWIQDCLLKKYMDHEL